MVLVVILGMAKSATEATTQFPRPATRRSRRQPPNPLGGNFILMPSLLDYLSPDLTLPEQYFAQQRQDDGMGAEKALMYAVLKDGIRSFYKYVGSERRKHRRLSDEAEQWILEDNWDDPFSFQVICDTLSIDPRSLRARLVEWKRTEMSRRELTGDTSSVQTGRSPFPTFEEGGDSYDDCEQDSPEHISLEDLSYEELDKVA